MRAVHLRRCTTRLELALSDSQSDVLTFSPSAPKCGNTANAILPYKRWTVVCTNAKISVYPKILCFGKNLVTSATMRPYITL